jgi:ParB-like chromosome segregation protein Spo0J
MIKCYFIEVQSIISNQPRSNFQESEIEKLADSILETDALIRPLIVQDNGNEKYTVIQGHLEYYAAVRAREKNSLKAEEVNAFVITEKIQKSAIDQISICDNYLLSRKQISSTTNTATLTEDNLSIDKLRSEVSAIVASHIKPILDRFDRQEKVLDLLEKPSEQVASPAILQHLESILTQLAAQKEILEELKSPKKVKIPGTNKKLLDFQQWCEQLKDVTRLDSTLNLINTLTEEQLLVKMKQSAIANSQKIAANIIDKRNTQTNSKFDSWETIFNAQISDLGEKTIKKIIEKFK